MDGLPVLDLWAVVTEVLHSSKTKGENHKISSLDAGLRMDGLLAHDVCDVVTEV